MAHYVGIDIIEVERINEAIARWGERFLNRVYTAPELSLCAERPQSLAARFACKEAVMKLLGAKNKGLGWHDIETLAYPSGKPLVNLYGRARTEAEKLGVKEIAVSLSHSKDYAIASVAGTSDKS